MFVPAIRNIDSQFDWTQEVKTLWEDIDWDRFKIINSIKSDEWNNRRNEIVLIGLCSSLLIEDAYRWNVRDNNNSCSNSNEIDPDQYEEDHWKKRQTRCHERENSNDRRPRFRRFTGEEPHFRSPNSGRRGIVECYGIYVEDWTTFLRGRVTSTLVDKGITLPEGPAIFLCPERIIEVYPTLVTLGEKFRDPLTLSCNPTMTNLKMVLLHELGHHFFPVHCSKAGKYISEGLANYFCLLGIEDSEKPWLLYKTWHLQPPEYSAYRFINLLERELGNTRRALKAAFDGEIRFWEYIFQSKAWEDIDRTSEYVTMAISLDYIPAKMFLKELDPKNQKGWYSIFDHDLISMHWCHISEDDGRIPADFLWDLYEGNSIYPWVFIPGLPGRIWSSWGCGDELSWPERPLSRSTKGVEDWNIIYKECLYVQVRNIAALRIEKKV